MKAKILLLGFLSSCMATPSPSATAAKAKPAREDAASIVNAAASEIEKGYVFADKGRALAEHLRARLREGRYAKAERTELARRLTEDMRGFSHDGHLWVEYHAEALPEDDARAKLEMEKRDNDRYYGERVHYGFAKVEHLPDNIGLLDLRVFAPLDLGPEVARAATAAMTLLATSDALVIDLRQNGGGGDMVNYLASYLFDDGPKPMSGTYTRADDKVTPGFTAANVPGPKLGGRKPVYVLISKKTFSAAEAFAYDLQALKRVVVIGEPSGGGAHPNDDRKLSPHFVLSLSTGRSINPITNADWEGTGVTPDVRVPAEGALDKALELARAAMARNKARAD
ncbi:S41 family peptidase [Pendulispora albinea]|uniref:S41 family peptidase n=1 Tax=Pendulispora albinea TaxID=2741071 RepID=A0ABZ2M346_9BACT